eukprot:1178424-Prorocentrum_minimum.AAC.5
MFMLSATRTSNHKNRENRNSCELSVVIIQHSLFLPGLAPTPGRISGPSEHCPSDVLGVLRSPGGGSREAAQRQQTESGTVPGIQICNFPHLIKLHALSPNLAGATLTFAHRSIHRMYFLGIK